MQIFDSALCLNRKIAAINNYAWAVTIKNPPLRWLRSDSDFPPIDQAWGLDSVAPGLLCAGGDLSVASLLRAYQHSVFPWFGSNQPILWWCPDPRMVLKVADFQFHSSLKKKLRKFIHSADCEIRVDSAFEDVILGCANIERSGSSGTWIVPEMVQAYCEFHHAGFAHSVETWVRGQLVGGLYFVAIGEAVFGESMFHRATDGSKIALAALACMCKYFNIVQIDCQQSTRHLVSFGAKGLPREEFAQQVRRLADLPGPDWHFCRTHWGEIAIKHAEQRLLHGSAEGGADVLRHTKNLQHRSG